MRILSFCLLLSLLSAVCAVAEGPLAGDINIGSQVIQTIKMSRTSAGTLPNRCDTVAAGATVAYMVANTSVIWYTATDASYNGVTVKRSWDADTAYMPIFTSLMEPPGKGVKTVTITNITSANAIICIERQINADVIQ